MVKSNSFVNSCLFCQKSHTGKCIRKQSTYLARSVCKSNFSIFLSKLFWRMV